MDDREKLSLEAMGRFVTASEDIWFEAQDRQQLYSWVEQVLVGHEYSQLGKAGRGLARRYIEKMTGLSRSQLTRLTALYTDGGRVQVTVYRRRRFAQLYTRAGIELLAAVDPVTVGQTGQYLRDGLSMNALQRGAAAISDTDAARRMQQAKAKLFGQLRLTA